MTDPRERLARDLHDLADAQRDRAETIDDIADAIADGLSVADAYQQAVDEQHWLLADAIRPGIGRDQR